MLGNKDDFTWVPGPLDADWQRQLAAEYGGTHYVDPWVRQLPSLVPHNFESPMSIWDQELMEKSPNCIDLASAAYGEASAKDYFEEQAAIANTIVHMMQGNGYISVEEFMAENSKYASGYNNERGILLRNTHESFKLYHSPRLTNGMILAMDAADNALSSNPKDYSNGAYF